MQRTRVAFLEVAQVEKVVHPVMVDNFFHLSDLQKCDPSSVRLEDWSQVGATSELSLLASHNTPRLCEMSIAKTVQNSTSVDFDLAV